LQRSVEAGYCCNCQHIHLKDFVMRKLALTASATVLIALSAPAMALADPAADRSQDEAAADAAFVSPAPQSVDRDALAEVHAPADEVAQSATAGGDGMPLEFYFYAGIILAVLLTL